MRSTSASCLSPTPIGMTPLLRRDRWRTPSPRWPSLPSLLSCRIATPSAASRSHTRYEAVTLPENVMDMEVEQPMLFSEADTANFQGMCLEDLDEQYVNVNLDDDYLSCAEHHHQAEAVNITLVDNFEFGLAETDVFNRFERFDIADDDTTINITPDEHPQAPSTLVPSLPRQEDPPQQQEQYYAAPSPFQEEPQQGW